jgi:DNA modification methylase
MQNDNAHMTSRRHTVQENLDFGFEEPIDEGGLHDDTVGQPEAFLSSDELESIEQLDRALLEKFRDRLVVQKSLTRQLVSFQANKGKPAYRWYKYKEAFSAPLIDFLLGRYGISRGTILDPFAGAGTALFVASGLGLHAHGIEVLPIGQEIIRTRLLLERQFETRHFSRLREWIDKKPWKGSDTRVALPTLRITQGAYPPATAAGIEKYLGALQGEDATVQAVLRFALLCVLESVSYTRKDGQYLRWDYRSGRKQGAKRFDKGTILGFDQAISSKLMEIVSDLSCGDVPLAMFPRANQTGTVELLAGSCLEMLPKITDATYDAVVTSPPYCNRYDYTRTYALELALLGISERRIAELRQEMVSCTVENREKDWLNLAPQWKNAIGAVDQQQVLQAILAYLGRCRTRGTLNNNGIPRMVRGYFYEMACVIAECERVMKSNSVLIMVNDNVRYAGASISVDLILSDIAEKLGFRAEAILVLPNGKGNSSQQMGSHGRDVLRKCVYVWRK